MFLLFHSFYLIKLLIFIKKIKEESRLMGDELQLGARRAVPRGFRQRGERDASARPARRVQRRTPHHQTFTVCVT